MDYHGEQKGLFVLMFLIMIVQSLNYVFKRKNSTKNLELRWKHMKFSSHFKVQLHFASELQVGLLIYAYYSNSSE